MNTYSKLNICRIRSPVATIFYHSENSILYSSTHLCSFAPQLLRVAVQTGFRSGCSEDLSRSFSSIRRIEATWISQLYCLEIDRYQATKVIERAIHEGDMWNTSPKWLLLGAEKRGKSFFWNPPRSSFSNQFQAGYFASGNPEKNMSQTLKRELKGSNLSDP